MIEREEDQQPESRHHSKVDALGRLAGGVAHDLNNMLMSIRGLTTLAMRELEPDHPLQADLEQIDKAAQRAADLTRTLGGLSPRQSGKVVPIDLNAALSAFELVLRRVLTGQSELRASWDARLPAVNADLGRLQRLILSFCVCVDDGRTEAGTIDITTTLQEGDARSPTGRHVLIRIEASGPTAGPAEIAAALQPILVLEPEPDSGGAAGAFGAPGGSVRLVDSAAGTSLLIHVPVPDTP